MDSSFLALAGWADHPWLFLIKGVSPVGGVHPVIFP